MSSSWYRVASLKPRLRAHMEVHRQPGGGDLMFFLQDHLLGKFYRFNINAHHILGRMDGIRTVHDIWQEAVTCQCDEAPTQDEVIELLGRLHAVDALQLNVTPDSLELLERVERNRKVGWKTVLRNPLSVRIPLFDPERALTAMMPIVGPVLSRLGFLLWLVIVVWAVFVAAMHWPELTHGGVDQILDPSNLLLLLCVYPVVKVFHEFGHAITTRKWGGEVHEMGVTFLVFMPVPYVDASAMSASNNKYQRMLISGSGMMVEMLLAAMALLVWINVEPGLVRLTAFNVMLVSGVSTFVFNGNPLLRFDAYYILKDVIDIPNLASRSSRYLNYLAQRYLFGLTTSKSPASHDREKPWLLCYGVAAMLFRVVMTFTIVLFIAGHFFIVGVLMALWALTLMVGIPIIKLVRYVLLDQALEQRRARALSVSAGLVMAVCGFIVFVPMPSATQAQGVFWLPEQAQVVAGTDGVVTQLLATPFTDVRAGQPLLEMADPLLESRIEVLESELDELKIRYRIETLVDQIEATLIEEQVASKQGELDRERERSKKLVVHSNKDGVFVLHRASDLPGRYVRQGERLGFVLDRSAMTVRVAVPQNRIGLVRESLHGVDVKLAESIKTTIPAALTRGVPAAQYRLPSKVLGRQGGGKIAVDPSDKDGLTTLKSVFLLDVTLRDKPTAWRIGQRAYVKFDHGKQPLAEQWYRLGRQLFIRRFRV